MTIQNKTARQLMYAWHDGQWSMLYQCASSGLCASFDALIVDINRIDDAKDKEKLKAWAEKKKAQHKTDYIVCGTAYAALPWIGRTH